MTTREMKAVLLDVSGVLRDNQAAMWACYQRVLKPAGFVLDGTQEEAYRLRGLAAYNLLENTVEALHALSKENVPLAEALSQPEKIPSAVTRHPLLDKKEWAQKLKTDFRRTDADHLSGIPPVARARQALARLSGRHKIGVVSNSGSAFNRAWMQHWRMDRFVSAWIGEENVTAKKPDPEGIQLCAKTLGVSSETAYFVGDSQTDMMAAQNAGVTGIGVLSGTATKAQLESAGAAATYQNLYEASHWI
ncbi:MAG: HAD-IA family hydrolase [Candidatus Micrarchaeota archaeon]|nr:HAD-IA family hydrolase [Candidatus Micrarchaeota archaeon]